jgi:hypothetical protein
VGATLVAGLVILAPVSLAPLLDAIAAVAVTSNLAFVGTTLTRAMRGRVSRGDGSIGIVLAVMTLVVLSRVRS